MVLFGDFRRSALVAALGVALALPTAALARDDTRAYAGLVFSFGSASQASAGLVVGAQATRVRASDRLTGFDVNARFSFGSGFDRIAVAGLFGKRKAYANLGAGINPMTGDVFLTGAAQAAHARVGLDFGLMGRDAGVYFELNTLQRLRPVAAPPPPGGGGAAGGGGAVGGGNGVSPAS